MADESTFHAEKFRCLLALSHNYIAACVFDARHLYGAVIDGRPIEGPVGAVRFFSDLRKNLHAAGKHQMGELAPFLDRVCPGVSVGMTGTGGMSLLEGHRQGLQTAQRLFFSVLDALELPDQVPSAPGPDQETLPRLDPDWLLDHFTRRFEEVRQALLPLGRPDADTFVRESRRDQAAALREWLPLLRETDRAQAARAPAEQGGAAKTAELTAVEKAIQIYLRETTLSVRQVAKQVPCDPSLLYRDDRFNALRASHRGTVPKGSKSKDGQIEAEGED